MLPLPTVKKPLLIKSKAEPMLFNLKEDVGERNNLYSDYPEKVNELMQRMAGFDNAIP
ncbi:MAG: hypothetical protein ACON39_02940 [Coraliomargaritaceae bacterium]